MIEYGKVLLSRNDVANLVAEWGSDRLLDTLIAVRVHGMRWKVGHEGARTLVDPKSFREFEDATGEEPLCSGWNLTVPKYSKSFELNFRLAREMAKRGFRVAPVFSPPGGVDEVSVECRAPGDGPRSVGDKVVIYGDVMGATCVAALWTTGVEPYDLKELVPSVGAA